MAALAVVQFVLVAQGSQYGFDFRGGTWRAAHALLAGHNLYPPANPAVLRQLGNGFITPPLLADIAVPFTVFGFVPALILWNIGCTAALAVALWVVGVRSWRVYMLALVSFPFVSSLAFGQPDGLFALAAALAWRHRGSTRGAFAAGTLVALKIVGWPLIVWLLATRRFRLAGVTAFTTIGMLTASWATIGFQGLASYPHLLAAESRAYGAVSHSFVTGVARLGASLSLSEAIAVALALVAAVAVVRCGHAGDHAWFTASLVLGLLSSPVVWQHYLVLIFVPLAIGGRLRDPVVWVLLALLWLSPSESPATTWQAWLVPVVVVAVAVRAVGGGAARQRQIDRGVAGPSSRRN